jgi:2-hydroxy-3-keto-5-methylthiopentenyl-1-phosphate phosphatase
LSLRKTPNIVVMNRGMVPTIRAVLSNVLPDDADKIEVIANGVKYTDEGKTGKTWEIIYRHPESGYGHDKSKAILPYRDLPNPPTLFFCGDGTSGMIVIFH